MADIKKLNLTLPVPLAIDLDVLSSRYNVSKKEVVVALIKIGLEEISNIADETYSKEILYKLQNHLKANTSIVQRTDEENKKYENLYGLKTEETFKADEENITYLKGLGDDI